MWLLLALTLSASSAQAGWIHNICERFLIVADDQQPYAEVETLVLAEWYSDKPNEMIKRELDYRLGHFILRGIEIDRVMTALNKWGH